MNLKPKALIFCLIVGAFSHDVFASMMLNLGETSHYIQVTPEYSHAVLTAVLPYFSNVAKKLDLPVSQMTPADVSRFHVLPFRKLTASMLLKNGWVFDFRLGYVSDFSSPHCYCLLQDPDKIPEYYGQVKMSRTEAIRLARDTLKKLDIPLEDVYAELEPQVILPVKIGTNTVPRYEVTWIEPYGGKSADFEINAQTKRVERMSLRSWSLERPPPKISVTPISAPDWPSVNPEYARQLIPMMFKAIDEYAQKLSLPVPIPLTTNNVARVRVTDNGGWPDCDVILTNGWRFVYRHTMVNGYYSPKVLLTDTYFHAIRLKDFEGKWNMTTNQAIEAVKKTLTKLNYPTNHIHMNFAPEIDYPPGIFKKLIPHYALEWDYVINKGLMNEELKSRVEAEVNADNGKVESLDYDDKAYWNRRPPIDVPISNGKYPRNPQ